MVVSEDIQNITFSREFSPGNRLVISFSCSITTHSILFSLPLTINYDFRKRLHDFLLFRYVLRNVLDKKSNCDNKNCFLHESNRLDVRSLADRLWKSMTSEMKSYFKFRSEYLINFKAYEFNKLNLDKKTHNILCKGDRTYAACYLCITKKKRCTSVAPCYCTGKKKPCIFYTPKLRPEKSGNFVHFGPEYFKEKISTKTDQLKNNKTESVQFENTNAESVQNINAKSDENIKVENIHPEDITEKKIQSKKFLVQMVRFDCLTRQDISLFDLEKPDKGQRPDPEAEKEN